MSTRSAQRPPVPQTGDSAPALQITGLSIEIGGRTLVEPLDLTIAAGERVGLIGESGSGKSLTASAVMGLLPDDANACGDVRLAGAHGNLLEMTDRQLSRLRGKAMSMVFQDPLSALNPLQRVGAQVAEVIVLHGGAPTRAAAAARAVELLASVDLPDPAAAARAYPHQLSGGQRQRVVLAIALANDPALLICDEPTTALDVTVQRSVLDLISAQVASHCAGLLFITHDLAVVAGLCQRVLVMNRGVVVESGSVEQIFTSPVHPYTRGLLAASDLESTDSSGRLFTIATSGEYQGAPLPRLGQSAARQTAQRPRPEPTAPAAHAVEPVPVDFDRADEGESLISVADLHKTYARTRRFPFGRADRVHALTGVSFNVKRGGRFGIVGESGSGKSTLLKILTGLETADSGRVRVADIEVTDPGPHGLYRLRQDLQLVFQDPFASLDPRMTVADIIAEPLIATSLDAAARRSRVTSVLADVGLDADAVQRYPHQFSGGQRQRISIARALAGKPRVLVADEPVSALDVSVRAQVLNLLMDLVDEYGLTLVFVSHDLGVVRHLCTDVAVMRAGRVVEAGPIERVYTHPRDAYTAGLIEATPNLARALEAARGI
ncbi:ABC transporter ATP-binding protein [Brevibacterium sp. 50QC2O2]|uniref:dipeptide ABC transporter ATP-binding protein n=1 Tax=Brevibacterium sp. 50QC2O2 TaxID=2968459 RepID=UPI00211CB6D5|nr:ABC transporter ATP-binding protein [Brevibacterium sp. 50QC2O2]MCQ9387331.1 ABC transporter ATP-binding protein [Brevibacterium sp. 50QC2O2]